MAEEVQPIRGNNIEGSELEWNFVSCFGPVHWIPNARTFGVR